LAIWLLANMMAVAILVANPRPLDFGETTANARRNPAT
jgi:hypothetical protein